MLLFTATKEIGARIQKKTEVKVYLAEVILYNSNDNIKERKD